MRRSLVAVTAIALTASLGLTAAPASADRQDRSATATAPRISLPDAGIDPADALATALRVRSGQARPTDPSMTVALRDLALVRDQLRGRSSDTARDLFDRPKMKRKMCNAVLCLHYTTKGSNRATKSWARTSFKQVKRAWKFETGKLGYRRPPKDYGQGGNRKFDFYLKDIGASNLYGFCSTENGAGGPGRRATSYCVLDNNFSRAEFPTNSPKGNLKVTAAHEFFHAIQFGYDYAEEGWIMESTATWMEERFADDVNDNRQYLPGSQLAIPQSPLTRNSSANWYGQWVFWEYFTQRKGAGLVKKVWNKAARTSAYKATKASLGGKGFRKNFTQYASATARPSKGWKEGASYPKAPKAVKALGTTSKRWTKKWKLKPTSLRHAMLVPGGTLTKKGWKVRIRFDMFSGRKGAGAYVVTVKKGGKTEKDFVKINGRGHGKSVSGFRSGKVKAVYVTLAHSGNGARKPGKIRVNIFR